mgnify:CR=1 FL=1
MSTEQSAALSVSRRGQSMPASPIRKLVPFADEAKAKGIKVYHLNIGQPDIPTHETVLQTARNFEKNVIAYTHSQGTSDFVGSLQAYYEKVGVSLKREEINVTTGGSEAVLFAFLLALNPGEEVLIPEPFYTNYNGFACVADVKIKPITTRGEDGFHLPSSEVIREKIGPNTKAILLCNPSNPTGTVYTRDEIDRIAALAKEFNLWLLCDEVYREFVFEPQDNLYRSALEIKGLENQVIVMDSISKRFSMCGSRIGCLVSRNTEIMDGALRLSQARLSSPELEQAMAKVAYELPDSYIPEVIDEYRKRRDVVYSALQKMEDVQVTQPEGAFYTIPKLPVKNTEHFAKWLLTDFSDQGETLMVAPAAGFYATPGLGLDEIRIAYVLDTTRLERAMELLHKALIQYKELEHTE